MYAVVEISKQCRQTALTSRGIPDLYRVPGLRLWTPPGDFRPPDPAVGCPR